MSLSSSLLGNSSDGCVREALRGLVAADPGLALVARGNVEATGGGGVLIRRQPRDAALVRVLSGGGAGHEPAFAGLVGPGLLDAAVSGHVFASPTPADILEAVTRLRCPSGVLAIVLNYTGDRLNFGLALARARTLNLRCRVVLCDDDAAIESPAPVVGRRGIAGALLMVKLACAMADAGCRLDDIADKLEAARMRLATVGACRLPEGRGGGGGGGSWELGLGIHGEAGVGRVAESRLVVDAVVDRLLGDSRLLGEGDQLAMLVNGLGGLSGLELSGVAGKVASAVSERRPNCRLVRLYVGSLMTSLASPGFSVSLLRLQDCWLPLLDAPAHRWPAASVPGALPLSELEVPPLLAPTDEDSADCGDVAWPSAEAAAAALAAVAAAADALSGARRDLNRLDGELDGFGDADCGDTMHRGAAGVRRLLAGLVGDLPDAVGGPRRLLLRLSGVAQRETGGSSGALLGVALAAAAGAIRRPPDALHWAEALAAAALAVSEVGGARRGDRTLLDAVCAFLDAFADLGVGNVGFATGVGHVADKRETTGVGRVADLAEVAWRRLPEATRRARAGAVHTAGMRPRAGRAAYVAGGADGPAGSPSAPPSPRLPDPGAWAAHLVLRAVCQAVGAVESGAAAESDNEADAAILGYHS